LYLIIDPLSDRELSVFEMRWLYQRGSKFDANGGPILDAIQQACLTLPALT